MFNILICDDDHDIVNALKLYLASEEHTLFVAYNGCEALSIVQQHEIHLVLLDIMMPELDGIAATAKLREISNIPIILLTAKSESSDKILGLNVGADDYITKPFDPKELVARVRAVLRRSQSTASEENKLRQKYIEYPDLTINLSNYSVIHQGATVEMPPKELELLYFLASSPNQVFTREQLLDHIWGYDYVGDTRTVDVHIKRLREKLKENPYWSLATVWGIGYKFEIK